MDLSHEIGFLDNHIILVVVIRYFKALYVKSECVPFRKLAERPLYKGRFTCNRQRNQRQRVLLMFAGLLLEMFLVSFSPPPGANTTWPTYRQKR